MSINTNKFLKKITQARGQVQFEVFEVLIVPNYKINYVITC